MGQEHNTQKGGSGVEWDVQEPPGVLGGLSMQTLVFQMKAEAQQALV